MVINNDFCIHPHPIPHGLVVRIRAFHARGRGSIPRGGVFKVEHRK